MSEYQASAIVTPTQALPHLRGRGKIIVRICDSGHEPASDAESWRERIDRDSKGKAEGMMGDVRIGYRLSSLRRSFGAKPDPSVIVAMAASAPKKSVIRTFPFESPRSRPTNSFVAGW